MSTRGPEAGLLVHLRPHGAGRGGSGIRRPHEPVGLGSSFRLRAMRSHKKLGADVRRARLGRRLPGRFPCKPRLLAFHPNYEYVVVDTAAGQASARQGSSDRSALRNSVSRAIGETGGWKGSETRRHPIQAPVFSIARARPFSPITSRSIRAAELFTPPPGPWLRRLLHRPEIQTLKPTRPQDDEGPLHRRSA